MIIFWGLKGKTNTHQILLKKIRISRYIKENPLNIGDISIKS